MIRYMLASPFRLFLYPRWHATIGEAEANRMTDDLYGDSDFQRPHRLYVEQDGEIILVIDIDELWQRCMKKRRYNTGGFPRVGSLQNIVHRNVRMQVHRAMKVRSC